MKFHQLQFKVCLFGDSSGLADLFSSPFTTDSSLTAPICCAGTNVCTSAERVDQVTDVAEKQQKVSPHSQGYFSGVLFPRLPEGCKGLDREPQGSSGAPTRGLTYRWNPVYSPLFTALHRPNECANFHQTLVGLQGPLWNLF